MRYFSTFSGIGGFEVGIHNAYRNALGRGQEDSPRVDEKRPRLFSKKRKDISSAKGSVGECAADRTDERPLCVGYSEIDKYASSVYEKHFEGVKNYGDITEINEKELPDFDCLVGGFPCQAFSLAGKRRGFEDTRGTLFFDLARILKEKQPRLFVFENVKGLLSHDKGRTFTTIIATIDELGYDCQWQVLNSKNFGVPQNRERVIIVGHLRGTPRPQVFPIAANSEADFVLPTLTTRYAAAQANGGYIGHEPSQDRKTVKVAEATKKGYAEAGVGQAINLNQPKSKTRRGRVSDIAPTIDTGMSIHTLTDDIRVRRLTPVECERLQAFPDNWTKFGIDLGGVQTEMSDTQRYKMCGNAVTTNVIQAVFERIFSE